jgi:hypothetical protein
VLYSVGLESPLKRTKGYESVRQTENMKTLKARVLSVLSLEPFRRGDKSDGQSKDTIIKFWRMRCSYPGPETFYECELREPLENFASTKYTVGLNGFVEFEMLSEPHIAAGDSIQIDAYEPEEKILEGGNGDHNRRAGAIDDGPEEANIR